MGFTPFTTKAAPASFHPANPATTTSTTLVMMGVGATVTYTPASSGIVQVVVTGTLQVATAVQTCTIGARYGTGTAPVNGAAVTGTRFGTTADPSLRPPSVGGPTTIAFNDLLVLTAGTTYWIDLALAVPGGGGADAANYANLSITLAETS